MESGRAISEPMECRLGTDCETPQCRKADPPIDLVCDMGGTL